MCPYVKLYCIYQPCIDIDDSAKPRKDEIMPVNEPRPRVQPKDETCLHSHIVHYS